MRQMLQRLLTKPIIRLSDKYSSRPDEKRVFSALSELHKTILEKPGKRGLVIPFNSKGGKFVILSDQHKGARDDADDFALAEKNYLAALDYYNQNSFTYINLGDSEELWENLFLTVKHHNKATFEKEKLFLDRNAFVKIFGNHDLYWDNDPLASVSLYQIYGKAISIYEGIILQTTINNKPLSIYMTHGHQGDLQSDGNWFSKWFVSNVWAPVQSYLKINPNTPANNDDLKTAHNQMMYEWSAKQQNTVLITGHTHQPVFQSLTHIESLYIQRVRAKKAHDIAAITQLEAEITKRHLKNDSSLNFTGYRPTYFNSGCCCFDDGDITGIEIADGFIRLIKWEYDKDKNSVREVLEERDLEALLNEMEAKA
jgi:predicted phosphodiesterase